MVVAVLFLFLRLSNPFIKLVPWRAFFLFWPLCGPLPLAVPVVKSVEETLALTLYLEFADSEVSVSSAVVTVVVVVVEV